LPQTNPDAIAPARPSKAIPRHFPPTLAGGESYRQLAGSSISVVKIYRSYICICIVSALIAVASAGSWAAKKIGVDEIVIPGKPFDHVNPRLELKPDSVRGVWGDSAYRVRCMPGIRQIYGVMQPASPISAVVQPIQPSLQFPPEYIPRHQVFDLKYRILLLLSSPLPLLCLSLRLLVARPYKPGHCKKCNYDLRASSERCPECGSPTAAPAEPYSNPRRIA